MIEIKDFGNLDEVAKKALATLLKSDPKVFFWERGINGGINCPFRILKHFSSNVTRHGVKGPRFRFEVMANELFAEGAFGRYYRSLYTLSINDKGELQIKQRKPGHLRLIKEQVIQSDDEYHLPRMIAEGSAMETSDILHGKPLIKVNDVVYMVMRQLPGVQLSQYITQNKLTIKERHAISIALVKALKEQIHDKGYVHRDISFANILIWRLGEEFIIYIIDFGFIKLKDYVDTKENIGNPYLAAPECFLSRMKTIKTDIYSLGRILMGLWGDIDSEERCKKSHYAQSCNPGFDYVFYTMQEVPVCYPVIKQLFMRMCSEDMNSRPVTETILYGLRSVANRLDSMAKLPNTKLNPLLLKPAVPIRDYIGKDTSQLPYHP